jgi:antitoxin component HigA of HigAB toxin-antitoxin module
MPRLKERPVPFQTMRMLIKSYGISGNKLSKVLFCSPPTACKKLKNPMLLTLEDLHRINVQVGIPWDEIKNAMKY